MNNTKFMNNDLLKAFFYENTIRKLKSKKENNNITTYVVDKKIEDLVKSKLAFDLTSNSDYVKVASFTKDNSRTINVRRDSQSTASIATLNISKFTSRSFDTIIVSINEINNKNVVRIILNSIALNQNFKLILILNSYEDLLEAKQSKVLKFFDNITYVEKEYNL